MAIQDIQIIDPFLDGLIQHWAIKDPKLYQALTNKKTITLDLTNIFEDVIVHSLKTADVGQRVEIDGTHGIRIYDSLNNLNVQLNGSALTIKTSPTGERLELDPVQGLRVFNSGGSLQTQFRGAVVTLPDSVILTQHLLDDAVTQLKIADDAVRSNHVQDLAIVAGKLATDSVVTANLVAGSVTAVKMSVGSLSAISADLGSITSGSIDAITITASDISGTTITGGIFQTDISGNNRVHIDSTDGLLLIDSSDVVRVQLNASIYSGILLNGLKSIDSNDIFLESNDQSCQLFVSSASQRVSFVANSVSRAYVDDQDGNGGGNQPTSLVIRVNGALQRVNRASSGGFLYI